MGPSRGRVLVVDDDFDIRETVSRILDVEGYEVAVAANGREALERARGGVRPCLILLDLRMPVMSGWEFRDEQARDPLLAAVPVVVLSGDPKTTLGGVPYLQKPLDLDRLLAVVEQHCAGGCC